MPPLMFQILLTFALLRFGLDTSMQRYPTPSQRLQQPHEKFIPHPASLLCSSPFLTDKPSSSEDEEVDEGKHAGGAAFLDRWQSYRKESSRLAQGNFNVGVI